MPSFTLFVGIVADHHVDGGSLADIFVGRSATRWLAGGSGFGETSQTGRCGRGGNLFATSSAASSSVSRAIF
jgi:hypothetical protein